jgi:hypothetical protein
MKILVAVNYVNYKDKERKYAQDIALQMMVKNKPDNVQLISFNYEDENVNLLKPFIIKKILKRDSSKIIGNNRRLPYIKEIFDLCSKEDVDIFGYFNSDIIVDKDFFNRFNNNDVYLFQRIDGANISEHNFPLKSFHIVCREHPGFDGVFFKKEWWLDNRDQFHDDLILGEAFWDYYYKKIVDINSDKILIQRAIYHMYHDTIWDLKSKGAINNKNINDNIQLIPLIFGLWWAGSKLSYLRYLTFKTLRHFHPDSKIELFVGNKCKKDGYNWGNEKQDFEHEIEGKDYLEELPALNVDIKRVDFFSQFQANYQSDLFRWWWLKENGGFYLDTDQIILKSFKTLPLDNNFIYSGYKAVSCCYYTPVGVLGASKYSDVVKEMDSAVPNLIDANNYNSAGPFALRSVLGAGKKFKDKVFNAPSNYFYPIPESFDVTKIFNGTLLAPRDSFALHWYGGNPISQKFNNKYDKFFAKNSSDTISCLVKEMGLL